MSRAVFLSIIRLFVIDQTWISYDVPQPHAGILNAFHRTIETAIDEIVKNDASDEKTFPTGKTLVKKEIAQIVFHPSNHPSLSKALTFTNTSRIVAFLSMTDYEVNLVTLEFLHRVFSSHRFNSTAEKHVEEIVKELLRLLLDSSMKGECLAMVSYAKKSKDKRVPCSELWDIGQLLQMLSLLNTHALNCTLLQ